jgi:lipopolysaccharide transport system permease protein
VKKYLSGMLVYLQGMWDCRYFVLSLVANDLRSRYRGSILGLGWSLLNPVLMTVVLCFAFSAIFQADMQKLAPSIFAGLTIWNFIAGAAQQGCTSFLQAESYIRQHPVPMAIYPLRTVLTAAFHLVIGLIPVIAVSGWFSPVGLIGVKALISLVPSLMLLLVLGWALAVIMGLVNVWFRDTRHLVDIFLQVVFYLTPIVYLPEQVAGKPLGEVIRYNPLVPFLNLVRHTILEDRIPSLTHFATGALAAVLCLAIAGGVLWKEERRLIFYL